MNMPGFQRVDNNIWLQIQRQRERVRECVCVCERERERNRWKPNSYTEFLNLLDFFFHFFSFYFGGVEKRNGRNDLRYTDKGRDTL